VNDPLMLYVPTYGSAAGFVVDAVPQSMIAVKWNVSPTVALLNVTEMVLNVSPYPPSLNTDDVTVKLFIPLLSVPLMLTAA
jgi:hypothetical protein